ncbi:MAG: GTPase YlqF [Tenericutes bacterium ADurb.Bin239]|nr:MAG: GTPase YlqF [Tenericutes bacterium ADurb.Bin239]
MTENLKKIKKCYGCGVVLQSESTEEVGYVPANILSRDDVFLCQRCFKTHHYSADKLHSPSVTHDFMNLIKDIKAKKALVVYVVDVFNFESSFNPEINEALSGLDIILVANKFDLLPKSTNEEKVKEYVARKVKKEGLNVKTIIVASSTRNYNIDEVLDEMAKYRNKGDVYFIGAVSSGKSSLIKTLLRNFKNETSRFITTSIYPNTTLAVQEIPISETRTIYDTPGISINNSLLGLAEKEVVKLIVPRREIKPRTYQLLPKQSILIGGIARFDYVDGPFSGFTFYFAEGVKLTRTNTNRADRTFNNMIAHKKSKPISFLVTGVQDLDAFEFTTHEDLKYDVSWNGLGFVSFKGNGRVVRIYAPRGVAISYNESKI